MVAILYIVISVTETQFDEMITRAMNELPQEYISGLQNVAIVQEEYPTEEQRAKQHLRPWQTLLGLYEGIPRVRRGSNYNLVLPDKITLFKGPLQEASHSTAQLQEHIKRTLWHEIAHYYGLDHQRIHELEDRH